MNPLFDRFPKLSSKITHITLGDYPTPVELRHIPGHGEVWLKRDDLCSDLYSGNKVRKLEFLLAAARREARCGVQTAGGVGSNHVVATSSFAKQLGLRCQAVLVPQPKSRTVSQNLRWSIKNGTKIFYTQTPSNFQKRQALALEDYRVRHGREPALIPMGGSSPQGNLGFVAAAFELATQIEQQVCPKPDAIYLPLGTMGTTVGLVLGFTLLNLDIDVVPVRVVSRSLAQPGRFEELFRKTNTLLNQLDPTVPIVAPKRVPVIRQGWLGSGYGAYTPAGQEAVSLFSRLGLKLEGTYTGKTVAAMLWDMKEDKKRSVMYWMTYNSADAPDLDQVTPPEVLRDYVSPPFQALDRVIDPVL